MVVANLSNLFSASQGVRYRVRHVLKWFGKVCSLLWLGLLEEHTLRKCSRFLEYVVSFLFLSGINFVILKTCTTTAVDKKEVLCLPYTLHDNNVSKHYTARFALKRMAQRQTHKRTRRVPTATACCLSRPVPPRAHVHWYRARSLSQ